MRVFTWFLFVVLLYFTTPNTHAQTAKAMQDVQIQAAVGEFFVTFEGYASPFASIVITTDGQILRSTTADETGKWTIPEARVKRGFSSFCVTTIDFKRLGESEACMEIEPIYVSSTIYDIFLPPTIGLFRKQVRVGQEAIIWGYSMPNSRVTIRINDNETITLTADAAGYYEYRFEPERAGSYRLKATAVYQGLTSLEPTKDVILEAQTIPQEAVGKVGEGLGRLRNLFSSTIFWFILIFLLLTGIIIFLIHKLYPGFFPYLFDFLKKKSKPLHDDWLIRDFPIP